MWNDEQINFATIRRRSRRLRRRQGERNLDQARLESVQSRFRRQRRDRPHDEVFGRRRSCRALGAGIGPMGGIAHLHGGRRIGAAGVEGPGRDGGQRLCLLGRGDIARRDQGQGRGRGRYLACQALCQGQSRCRNARPQSLSRARRPRRPGSGGHGVRRARAAAGLARGAKSAGTPIPWISRP